MYRKRIYNVYSFASTENIKFKPNKKNTGKYQYYYASLVLYYIYYISQNNISLLLSCFAPSSLRKMPDSIPGLLGQQIFIWVESRIQYEYCRKKPNIIRIETEAKANCRRCFFWENDRPQRLCSRGILTAGRANITLTYVL